MFFKPIQWAWSAVVGLILLYVFFFVPLGGRKTLFEHVRAIAATPEAQEFGHDVSTAGRQAVARARDEIEREVVASDGGLIPSYRPASATPPPRTAQPDAGAVRPAGSLRARTH